MNPVLIFADGDIVRLKLTPDQQSLRSVSGRNLPRKRGKVLSTNLKHSSNIAVEWENGTVEAVHPGTIEVFSPLEEKFESLREKMTQVTSLIGEMNAIARSASDTVASLAANGHIDISEFENQLREGGFDSYFRESDDYEDREGWYASQKCW